MKTGRDDWDAMIKVSGIPEAEPVFVLRAQDPNAAEAVRAWAFYARDAGVDVAVIEQALRQADAMDQWPTKKLPDADRLAEPVAKQLRYAFGRRIWREAIGTNAPAAKSSTQMVQP